MALQLAKLPRLIIERRSSVILGLVIIVMLWVVIGLKYFEDAASGLAAERVEVQLKGFDEERFEIWRVKSKSEDS